jgi:hypothetical protein
MHQTWKFATCKCSLTINRELKIVYRKDKQLSRAAHLLKQLAVNRDGLS